MNGHGVLIQAFAPVRVERDSFWIHRPLPAKKPGAGRGKNRQLGAKKPRAWRTGGMNALGCQLRERGFSKYMNPHSPHGASGTPFQPRKKLHHLDIWTWTPIPAKLLSMSTPCHPLAAAIWTWTSIHRGSCPLSMCPDQCSAVWTRTSVL